jgi:tRNA(Ile)-lysidine synthase
VKTEHGNLQSLTDAAKRDAAERVRERISVWLSTSAHDLCVAYSGGLDSSVLLHALVTALAERGEIKRLSALHVHHGLQANADHWREHCARVASALGIPFYSYQARIDRNDSRGIEAAARDARYAIFDSHLTAHVQQRLLIAHHAQDQAESVLLQLLRGAGPSGLSGMAYESTKWSRPLLNVAKADIDAYQIVHQVAHITDDSNADTRFARNRLRARVWPTLVANFPAAEATLARAARWQQEASALADTLAELDFAACKSVWGVSVSKWAQLNSTRRRNVLRYWFSRLALPAQGAARLCEWERQIESSGADSSLELSHCSFVGSFRRYRDDLCYVAPVDTPNLQWRCEWRGEARFSWPHGVFNAARHEGATKNYNVDISSQRAPDLYGRNAVFRYWRSTDLFEFSPNEKTSSLKHLFQQHAIPVWLRASWPILEVDGQIAAVVGLKITSGFRAPPAEDSRAADGANNDERICLRWIPQGAPDGVVFECGPIVMAPKVRDI